MCRYNWHSAGSLGWPFPMLQYKYIFQKKYAKAILSNSTRKLLWFQITEMPIAVKNTIIMSFIIIFCKRSFPIFLYISQFIKKTLSTVLKKGGSSCDQQRCRPTFVNTSVSTIQTFAPLKKYYLGQLFPIKVRIYIYSVRD